MTNTIKNIDLVKPLKFKKLNWTHMNVYRAELPTFNHPGTKAMIYDHGDKGVVWSLYLFDMPVARGIQCPSVTTAIEECNQAWATLISAAIQPPTYIAAAIKEARLERLSQTYDVPLDDVKMFSDALGGNEADDGLVSMLEDYTDEQLLEDF